MRKLTQLTLLASAALISTAAVGQHSGQRTGHGSGHGSGSSSSSSGSSSGSSSSSSSSSFSASRSHTNVVIRQRGGHVMQPGAHPGPNFRHHRLQRGFFVHPYWFGPRFHVQNWQRYGFAQPPRDHRWVRFYDDAYLIDQSGRVADHRYGLDWDQYGERWTLEDGIPHYYGSNDWRPDEDDYAWVERRGERHRDWDDREERSESLDHRRHGPSPGCQPTPRSCSSTQAYPGYGYGYGYGYGVVYPPIIIETTVTTGACCHEVVEEVIEVRQRPQRNHRPRTVRPRPRPPAGERG